MSNISPTVNVDISTKPGIIEEILLGAACSPEEVVSYKSLFQEHRNIFAWAYFDMLGISLAILENHIDTWIDSYSIRKKKCQLHPSVESVGPANIHKISSI